MFQVRNGTKGIVMGLEKLFIATFSEKVSKKETELTLWLLTVTNTV